MANKVIISPEARMSFMRVFKAEPDFNNNPVFSVTLLIPKSVSMAWVETAWKEVAREEFGTENPPGLRPLYSQDPMQDRGWIKDGTKKYLEMPPEKQELYSAYKDHWLVPVKCEASSPPGVVGPDKQEIINQADFQSGDFGRAVIELSSYTSKKFHSNQISVRLRAIQMTRRGERFSGGISAESAIEMLDPVEMGPANVEDLF